jgi:hypothetical protein
MINHLKKALRLLRTERLSKPVLSIFTFSHFHICILFFFCLLSVSLFSQNSANNKSVHDSLLTDSLFKNKKEIYFDFKIKSRSEINKITKIISINKVRNKHVYASANKKEFRKFLALSYRYTITKNPSMLRKPKMLSNPEEKKNNLWNAYPTYVAYEKLMYNFAKEYPDLCKLDTIGILASGRKLLAARISGKTVTGTGKPHFLYTASIHGNEPLGYVLMLHLIDSLLSGYNNSSRITKLVDNTEIFINPLANPDGTYAGGDSTVYGATRVNANEVDLNRNYPDPDFGPHPDREAWQSETRAFMAYATKNHFVISMNFHSGSEVFNYPWDDTLKVTADDSWWRCTGTQFADTIHKYSRHDYFKDYFDYTNIPGVTDGYTWYQVTGGRQDYMNYFQHCRECTVELSHEYIPDADSLPVYWKYDYRSFLDYIEKSLQGIHGTVTDSASGKPIHAMVTAQGHDYDSSEVFSYLPYGDYYKLISGGTYNITYSAAGYHPKTINNIYLADNCDSAKTLNVILAPVKDNIKHINYNEQLTARISPNPNNGSFKIIFNIPVKHLSEVKIFDLPGNELYSYVPEINNISELNVENTGLIKGLYLTRIKSGNNFITLKTVIY